MTGIIGAFVDAWDEVRIHKLRVMLSLFGVAVAVAALTGVSAFISTIQLLEQESMERWNGRPGTVTANTYSEDGTSSVTWVKETNAVFTEFVERYEVSHSSRIARVYGEIQAGGFPAFVQLTAVDQQYGMLHRIPISEGGWFTSNDDNRLAPAIVINETFLEEAGLTNREVPFSADLILNNGTLRNSVVVAGVIPRQSEWESAEAYILMNAFTGILERQATPGMELDGGDLSLELWLGTENLQEDSNFVQQALAGSLGDNFDVGFADMQWVEESARIYRIIGFGISGLVLGLAALNLLNIAMVTLQQRIREIGIRRAFGASSGRVFFSVMMESVVATVVAGAIGVVAVAVAFMNLPIDVWLGDGAGMQGGVPFPVGAAVVGMVAATGVGALTGLIPALVAVRIKPIDAIRF